LFFEKKRMIHSKSFALDSANTIRAYYDVLATSEDNGVPMGNTDFRSDVSQAAKKFYAQRNM
jgi:hypothetical protein